MEKINGVLMIEINEKKNLIKTLKDSIDQEIAEVDKSLVEHRKIIQDTIDALYEKLKEPQKKLLEEEKSLEECINKKNKILQPYCSHTNRTPTINYNFAEHNKYGICDDCNCEVVIELCNCYRCSSSSGIY